MTPRTRPPMSPWAIHYYYALAVDGHTVKWTWKRMMQMTVEVWKCKR